MSGDTSGKEISYPPSQLKKTSTNHDRHFSTLVVFIGVFCGDISSLSSRSVLETCDANSSLWVRQLDPHREYPEEARVIPSSQMHVCSQSLVDTHTSSVEIRD